MTIVRDVERVSWPVWGGSLSKEVVGASERPWGGRAEGAGNLEAKTLEKEDSNLLQGF